MIRRLLLLVLMLPGVAQAQSFQDCPTCPEMVRIPAGAFAMGPAISGGPNAPSPYDEDRMGDGQFIGPKHRVTIGASFAIGKYEVTRGEFAAFVAATGRQMGNSCDRTVQGMNIFEMDKVPPRSWRDPGFAQTDRHPVVCVSWNDAKAYVAWLSQVTGKAYRLPSEAEWEYAARAGTQTPYYWGAAELRNEACRFGNFADLTIEAALKWKEKGLEYFLFECSDGYVYTAPVGTFQPNAFGLYDMLGNALEWTEDCHNKSFDGAPTDGSAWLAGNCTGRIARGGSWDNHGAFAHTAFRRENGAGSQNNRLGFRVARNL